MSFEFLGPEQIAAAMQAQNERAEIAMESFRHNSQRLFEELDEVQLTTLRDMFHGISMSAESIMAAYYEGMASQLLKDKFNICQSCGVNHDKEDLTPSDLLLKQSTESIAWPSPGSDEQPVLPLFEEMSDGQKEMMAKYHLDDLRDDESGALLGFVCTGVTGKPCGMTYPTIEDRMLKAPDDCPGCQVRAAHG